MSVGLYGVFLAIQTRRHRDYFVSPERRGSCGSYGESPLMWIRRRA